MWLWQRLKNLRHRLRFRPKIKGTRLSPFKRGKVRRRGIRDIPEVKDAIEAKKPVFIYFHSKDCAGCKLLTPEVQILKATYGEQVTFVDYSIDNKQEEATSYGVVFVPTVMCLDDEGDLRFNNVGVQGGDTKATIDRIQTGLDNLLT